MIDERVCTPFPVREIERRWAAVRSAMELRRLDALVVQGANNFNGTGGYLRWFTGISAPTSYPQTIIFPKEGLITLVSHGAAGDEARLDGRDPSAPGVGVRFSVPSFPGVAYTCELDANIIAREIVKGGYRRVALVGTNNMYFGFGKALLQLLPSLQFDDATDSVDAIKAVKSEDEIVFIRRTAVVQDEIMRKVRDFIKPGMRDYEVMAYAHYSSQLLGSETGYMLGSSAPPGVPALPLRRSDHGRQIRAGDKVFVQTEHTGPGGLLVHHGRLFVLGKASAELQDLVSQTVEAQDFTIGLLKPGASCREVFHEYNSYMRSRGFAEERRVHCHGQGYDVVERPLIGADETMAIAANMNIGIHPTLNKQITLTDNFLIGTEGLNERLHTTPREVVEI